MALAPVCRREDGGDSWREGGGQLYVSSFGHVIHKIEHDISDHFTEENKEAFKDPQYYKRFRWELEAELNVRRFVSC